MGLEWKNAWVGAGQSRKCIKKRRGGLGIGTNNGTDVQMTNRQGKGNRSGKTKNGKSTWKLGTWNVRSINNKEQELSDEFDKLDIDILTLTETKRKGNGEEILENGHLLIYSGVASEKRAAEGVGCIINKSRIKQVRKWEQYSERILALEINIGGNELVTVITAYGPNEDEKIEIKNKFWEDLNEATERSKGKIFVAGDLNGRVGNNDTGNSVIGKYGETRKSRNGDKIIEFCILNNMIVTNTFFEHRDIHRYTRQGKSEHERSIIDYILADKNNRRDILDVRVRRGPEIYSDHYMLVAKIRKQGEQREDNRNIGSQSATFRTIRAYKLRNRDLAIKYKQKITQKINSEYIDIENENVESLWLRFKEVVLEAAREVCGTAKMINGRKQTNWWNENIKNEVKKKKKNWRTYLSRRNTENYEIYKRQRLKVKNMIREAKEESWRRFGEKMERNSKENQKLFYKTLKNLRRKKGSQSTSIKGEDGQLLTEERQIMDRWRQHFEDLLKPSQQEDMTNLNAGDVHHVVEEEQDSQEISIEELNEAIGWLKSGKTPGHDHITAEMLKSLGDEGLQLLLEICNKAWKQKRVPNDWRVGVILPLHKKGDMKNCNNYRGITLLSTAVKTYERILERRISKVIEPTLSESQSGFRKGRSIQDHIFSIKQIINKALLSNTKIFFAFIDLEKAFDKIKRQTVWDNLRKRQIREHLLGAIKSIYVEDVNYVIYRNMKSTEFKTSEGLRQGGVLSPVLFGIIMDEIIKQCTPKLKKPVIGYRTLTPVKVSECVFADDVAIIADSRDSLQHNLEAWDETFTKYGMKINIQKTKVMMTAKEEEKIDIKLRDECIEQVAQIKYLGVTLERNGSQEADIDERIQNTMKTYHSMKHALIKKREVSRATKMTIFKTIFRPVLTFGCESWTVTKRIESKLEATEMKYLRGTLGVTRLDRRRNEDIRQELGTTAVKNFIEERQLGWWGHLQRLEEGRQVKRIWEARVKIKRGRGRPRESWDDTIARILQKRGKQVQEARRLARNKKQWTRFVHCDL